jgi:ribose 5-phosphate isomerase RpiB
MARNDEDVNVLCLGGMITSASAADRIVDAFLQTPFAGHTRYKRRLKQIKNLE